MVMDREKEEEIHRQLLERLEKYTKDKEDKRKLADRAIDRTLKGYDEKERFNEKDRFNDSH